MDQTAQDNATPPSGFLPEYTEANTYLRHYSSLRFVMVSVYFAVTAALVSAAFRLVGSTGQSSELMVRVLRGVGLIVTVAFGMYELRLETLIRYYQDSLRALEPRLGYTLMSAREKSDAMFWATRALYATFLLLWILSQFLYVSLQPGRGQ